MCSFVRSFVRSVVVRGTSWIHPRVSCSVRIIVRCVYATDCWCCCGTLHIVITLAVSERCHQANTTTRYTHCTCIIIHILPPRYPGMELACALTTTLDIPFWSQVGKLCEELHSQDYRARPPSDASIPSIIGRMSPP